MTNAIFQGIKILMWNNLLLDKTSFWLYTIKVSLLCYFEQSSKSNNSSELFCNFFTDRSAVTILIWKSKNLIHGPSFWKFNSFLLSDQKYVRKTKHLIQTFHSNHNLISNTQLRWELLRYEKRKSKFESQRGLRHMYIRCFFVLLRF